MQIKNSVEWRNFFTSLREMRDAQRAGQPTDIYVAEIEAIAMHSDDEMLRGRARQTVASAELPSTAIA